MKTTFKNFLLLVISLLLGPGAQAQVNLSTLSYSQDFTALGSASGTWSDNATLAGWYTANYDMAAGLVTPYTAYTAGSGGGTSSSTLYSLGVSGSSERALGGAPASTRYSIIGLRLVNDTGSMFDGLEVRYDLEQWSDRGTATVKMSYQKFAPGTGSLSVLSGWTDMGSAVSPLPQNATPVTGIGNTTGLLAGVLGGASELGLLPNEELWIRWEITKIAGNNATHGIDNVLVSVPEPSSALLVVLGAFAFICRRAKRL